MRIKFLCFFMSVFFLAFQVFALNAPVHLEPVQATYHKITIKWENGDTGQVASYRIYRNQTEIAAVTDTQYTDSNLDSGTQYTYQLVAVGPGNEVSSPSVTLNVKTIKSVTFDNSASVEQAVDSLHPVNPSNLTGLTLLSAVKSGIEALLSTNITFTAVDSDILTNFVEQELAVIKEVEPSMTDAERLTAQTELDNFLSANCNGNSFEHVYIQSKLSELAEEHYQKGFKTGATALYEFSLNYLKDQEPVVFGTLARLAAFKLDTLTETSTPQEIATALADYKNTYSRLFEFFPDSISSQAQAAYSQPAYKYFHYFPVLLNYDSYNSTAFTNALQLAQSALTLNNDAIRQKLYDRIAAWELVQQNIEFKDSSNNLLNGSITVKNITANTALKDVFPGDPYEEERTIQVVNGQATFPIYKGHIYNAIAHFNVQGGNPLNYSIDTFAHTKGQEVTYNNMNTPVSANLPAGTNYAKSSFVFDPPSYPYNLTYERAIDTFTLRWEWLAPSGFTLKNFKVFCGGNVVATVIGNSANNIPILPDEGVHFYTVVAYDVNDIASVSSQPVFVLRDNAGYAGYFAWMQQHFGSQTMYSCDDPDGDGVDNYHEYLNGTDPTRIPGPAMRDPGQIGYSKAVLNWDQMFVGEAGVTYKIYRNDTEVGTASGTTFTDTGLTPGLAFIYRVRAVKQDGTDTEQGAPITVRTIASVTFNGSDKVQQVVDSLLPVNAAQYTGSTLIAAVKSGIEALSGSSVMFSTVSNDILNNFVTQELAIINEVAPPMTDAERLAAKTELNSMLNDGFGGNSFEHVYIYSKLTELGEEYYQKGDKEMGTALYELSLNYLKNMESSVFNTLARLAAFKLDTLTETSTNEQIVTALDAYRDTCLRFFTFFPDSTSQQAQSSYTMAIYKYFKYFPTLLKYDFYNQNVFNSVKQLSEAALTLNNDSNSIARQARISAWELTYLKIKNTTTSNQPIYGTITIKNVSSTIPGNNVYPSDPVIDVRTFQVPSGEINIPVYKGHTYNITSSLDIGGNYVITTGNLLCQNGYSVKYTLGQIEPTTQSLAEGANYAELVFAYDVPPELASTLDSDNDGIPDTVELAVGYDPAVYTEVIYVDASHPDDSGNGMTPATAKKTINAAITASKFSGKEHVVVIAAGIYTGSGNKNLDFGGYNIKLRSASGAAFTIIDLENSGRFVYLHTGESLQSWIDGFTVKNGNPSVPADGGCLLFKNAQATVKNCIFSNNYASHGGAIYMEESPSQVTNCKFNDNRGGTYGGAVFQAVSAGSEFKSCEFTGNQAGSGGAIYLNSGSMVVENCHFLSNRASFFGGVVCTELVSSSSSLTLTNSLLLDNHNDLCMRYFRDSIIMKNVTIAYNLTNPGDETSCSFEGSAVLTNNIILGRIVSNGTMTANNNCSSTYLGNKGLGNITSNPLLTATGYLKSGSPCIDTGNAAEALQTDLDGVARPVGNGIDIGCYEYNGPSDGDGDGIPDIWEVAHGLNPNVNDIGLDADNDGLTNTEEYTMGTDPHNSIESLLTLNRSKTHDYSANINLTVYKIQSINQ